jgi:AbrB family looped-hinge helix DNA binding protein
LTIEEAQVAVQEPGEKAAVADELADILSYCLSLSNALDLDVSSAVLEKLQANEHRYPLEEFRGRFRRPEREKGGKRRTLLEGALFVYLLIVWYTGIKYYDIPIDSGGAMETVTVSPKYQVVIPSRIRRLLGVEPGQKVKVILYDNRIEMIPVRPAKQVRGFLKGIDTTVERESDRL